MHDSGLVSCVTATYGRFSLLQEMYWCWLKQTYENKELVILNDQAELKIICDDKRVKIINVDQRFATLGEKRNYLTTCVSEESKYILIYDDDDLSFPNHITNLVKGFSSVDDSFNRVGNKKHMVTKDNVFINYNFYHPYFCASMFKKEFLLNNQFDLVNTQEDRSVTLKSKTLILENEVTFVYRHGLNIVHAFAGNKIGTDVYNLIEEKREKLEGEVKLTPRMSPGSLRSYYDLLKLI
jgi:hypothetical protein